MVKKLQIPNNVPDDLQLLVSIMDETRKILYENLEGVDQKMLDFTPSDRKVESIATLLFHIAGVEYSWILEDIGGLEMDFEKWKYAFPLREYVDIPQIQNKPLEYFKNILQEVRNEVKDFLKEMDDEKIHEIILVDGSEFTIPWIVFHVIEHELKHIGQISILKRLYNINK